MKKLLTLTLALALLLSACGVPSAPAETPEATAASTVVRTEVVYPLPAPAELVGVARVGDTLLLGGESGGAPVLGMAEWSLGAEGLTLGETRLLTLPAPEAADEARLWGVAAGEDCFYVLTGEEPASRLNASREIVRNEDYQGRYCVLKYAADGALLGQMTLRDWSAGEMLGIAAGPDGELLLYACQTAALLHWRDGEAEDAQYLDAALAALGADAGFLSAARAGDCWCAAVQWVDGRLHTGLFTLAVGAFSPLELEPIADGFDVSTVLSASWSPSQGLAGEYLVNDGEGFYAVDPATGAGERLLLWNADGAAIGSDCGGVCRLGERAAVYTLAGDAGLHVLYEADAAAARTVRVAVFDDSSRFREYEARCAALSGDWVYRCEFYDFSQRELLLTKLASGADAPDLLLFPNPQNIGLRDMEGYYIPTDSALFDDLLPYLDADPALSRESFLPGLLDAVAVNGRLTQLWSSVCVQTILAREADVPAAGLGAADCLRAVAESERYQAVFEYPIGRELLLALTSAVAVSEYADRETASARFDDGGFAALLDWIAAAGSDAPYGQDVYPSLPWHLEDSLLKCLTLRDVGGAAAYRERFGEPYAFVGYPVGAQSESYYVSAGECMAIPAAGRCKDGAWAYISGSLSLAEQLRAAEEGTAEGLPVNAEALSRLSAALAPEDAEKLNALLAGIRTALNYADEPLRQIILTGAQSYLSGDKTAEESAALVQSRASVYMAEKYGA